MLKSISGDEFEKTIHMVAEALGEAEKEAQIAAVKEKFLQAGADAVILNMKELPDLL